MNHTGKRAEADFILALDREGKPQYDEYQLRMTDNQKHDDRRPLRYRIDVDRDLPPEIKIVEPTQQEVSVAENGQLQCVHASDPDSFGGLRRVDASRPSAAAQKLPFPVLLDRVPPAKALAKPYDGECLFRPAEFHLKAGDRVTYWAEAEDNKEPQHNQSHTPHQTIRIISDQEKQQEQKQPQQGEGSGKSGDEKSKSKRHSTRQARSGPRRFQGQFIRWIGPGRTVPRQQGREERRV